MPTTVRFEPWGVTVEGTAEQSLLDAAQQAEIPIGAVCGGRGTCGKCLVRILTQPAPSPVEAERKVVAASALEQGFRLACMHRPDRDLTVEILPIISYGKGEAPPLERLLELAPPVRRLNVTLTPPSLDRPIADGDNLLAGLAEAGWPNVTEIDYRSAQMLSEVIRQGDYRVSTSVRNSEIISVRPANRAVPPLGLAVDLGTTNIATYLYTLNDGTLLGVFGAVNPLVSYGADILSRLIYAGRLPTSRR